MPYKNVLQKRDHTNIFQVLKAAHVSVIVYGILLPGIRGEEVAKREV